MNKVRTPVFYITRSGGTVSEKVAWDLWYSSGVWLKKNSITIKTQKMSIDLQTMSIKNNQSCLESENCLYLSIHPYCVTVKPAHCKFRGAHWTSHWCVTIKAGIQTSTVRLKII